MREIWQIINDPPCLWRAWDDEIVVYCEASGDTHRLNPLAAEVFETLIAAPASLAQLEDRVAASLGIENDPELKRKLDATVRRLLGFGLLEPCM